MSDYDMVDRLEKQIQGSNLALAAVAEVLQKMDSRLSKAEEEDFELAQDQEDAIEKNEIIKAVAGEVYGLIKADQEGDWGMVEKKAKGISNDKADSEVAAPSPAATKDVQVTLEAMQKQLNLLKEGYFGEEEGENGENGVDEEEEARRKAKEEEGEEEEFSTYSLENAGAEYPVLENMQKQITALTNAVKGNFDMQKMVQNETEGRLRKMGFREETSLQRPMRVEYGDGLGIDGTTPITKTADSPEAMVDQMMNMSYKDLRVLQEQIQSGETDGIPQEFLG